MLKTFKKLQPYTFLILLNVVFIFISVFADLNLPNSLSKIIDIGVYGKNKQYIIMTGIFMLLIAVISFICNIISGFLAAKISTDFAQKLRGEVFRKVEDFSLEEMDKFGTSSLITRTTNDITQIQTFVQLMLKLLIMMPLMAVGGIIMAYSKSPELSNVIAISMPILIIAILIIAKYVIPLSVAVPQKLDRVNLVLREKLTGIRVIRAFNTQEHEKQKFELANTDLTQTVIKMQRVTSFLLPIATLVLYLTSVAITWSGAKLVDQGQMQVGDIVAVLQYIMQIMLAFMMMTMVFVMLPRARASMVRVNEVLDTQVSIKDENKTHQPIKQKGYIEFKDVSLTFHGADEPTIKNISFFAKPGQTTAIIGSTGSGKSSIINLIPRFYDTTEGAIFVDGIDIKELSLKELRERIGFVPQKAVLFRGTIKENIKFGNEQADDATVQKAAEIAQASDFIASKEEGYDAEVSQGGANLSGGQKQRIAIARAVVRTPEIYIFDDSFSALDFKTDIKLRRALSKETVNSTVIIVAQRVSTIKDADCIIVLENGQIAGKGKHQDLLQSCEVYKEIVTSQLSAEEM